MKKKIGGFMIYFLMFLGLALSIVKANGWIVIPTFCIVFCFIVGVVCWIIYAYANGIGAGLAKEMKSNGKVKYVNGKWEFEKE